MKSQPKIDPELTHEVARAVRPAWAGFGNYDRINQSIARSEGYAQSIGATWDQGVYGLFDEMEDKDAHLFSILQTRKNGILARPRSIEAGSDQPEDIERAKWLEQAIGTLPTFEGGLTHLLDALAKGFAIIEIIWGYDAAGRIVPIELKPRAPWRFTLDAAGDLHLQDSPYALFARPEQTGQPGDGNRDRHPSATWAENSRTPLPPRKFMTLRFGASDERPYGRGLCERVYWYWWFKKNNLKFWVLYNEKFGAPTVVARHPMGLSQNERDRLLEVIASLQVDAGVTVPEGIELGLLESTRSGSADTYRTLADWCNAEMSRAVLGQTLTVGEGDRSGSLALARVHEAVRFDYIRTDACLLMNAINSQLIRWMIDLNFGEQVPAPRWRIDLTPDLDIETEVAVDRELLQMGVPLPKRYFYDRYKRPAPVADEEQLRYDDSNLFQYHLQYGVLSINEVRVSLGLPPVPWGDRPTSLANGTSSPPTPEPAASDVHEDPDEADENSRRREP